LGGWALYSPHPIIFFLLSFPSLLGAGFGVDLRPLSILSLSHFSARKRARAIVTFCNLTFFQSYDTIIIIKEKEMEKMLIHTIEIEYQEPFTGVWVKGRNEYFFRNEKDLAETIDRWTQALNDRYNDTATVIDLTAIFS